MSHLKDFDGLQDFKQMEGKTLCLCAYKWLESLSVEDFNQFSKTAIGGAIMFIANQYAQEYDRPVMYADMLYDPEGQNG